MVFGPSIVPFGHTILLASFTSIILRQHFDSIDLYSVLVYANVRTSLDVCSGLAFPPL